jgi:transcriptional regulator with XRE-family HTH domain
MSRKRSSFDKFMDEVAEETRAAGPAAEAAAEAVRGHFRLAAQVLRLRREVGLTQQQLAKRVGVNQSEISKIERGAMAPGFRMLTRLADGLNADVDLVARAKPVSSARRRVAAKAPVRRAPRAAAYAWNVKRPNDR